jgi:hypothetical protein
MGWVVQPVPVVDRASRFRAEQGEFAVERDARRGDDVRRSIAIETGLPRGIHGSRQGLHLVVSDGEAARALDLVRRSRRSRRLSLDASEAQRWPIANRQG